MGSSLALDSSVLRGVMTLLLILSFVAIVLYAYSARRRSTFEAISRLPLEEDRPEAAACEDRPP